jgi:hypothetical protein
MMSLTFPEPARATWRAVRVRRAARDRIGRSLRELEHPTFEGGGSRSRVAWARPARTWPASTRTSARRCASGCRRQVPSEPFMVTAVAWAARGLA